MDFDKNILQTLIEDVSSCSNLEISEIPCVDLYMDQVISLFDEKLKDFKRNEEDKTLTKTMINNYAKSKVLMPAKNKKYSKDHIILLTLIYHLKQIISINDISTLFTPLIENLNESENDDTLVKIYSKFLDMKKTEYQNFSSEFNEKLNLIDNKLSETDINDNDLAKWTLIILTLINQANLNKRMAEKIIDTVFNNSKE